MEFALIFNETVLALTMTFVCMYLGMRSCSRLQLEQFDGFYSYSRFKSFP